jgi:hypothetical protein
VAGRGARFQRGGASSLSVLVYAPAPSALLTGELGKLSVDGVLTRAGYRPATAVSADQLGERLRSSSPDIVVVDVGNVRAVEKYAPAGAAGPIILPVLKNPSRQEVADARKTWGVVLRGPASGDSFLDAVDEAIDFRAKERKSAETRH